MQIYSKPPTPQSLGTIYEKKIYLSHSTPVFFTHFHLDLLPTTNVLTLASSTHVPNCLPVCRRLQKNSLTYLSSSVEKEIKIIFLILMRLFHYGYICHKSRAASPKYSRDVAGSRRKGPENSLHYKSINYCVSAVYV